MSYEHINGTQFVNVAVLVFNAVEIEIQIHTQTHNHDESKIINLWSLKLFAVFLFTDFGFNLSPKAALLKRLRDRTANTGL